MRAAPYIWVPHVRDGLIVANVGGVTSVGGVTKVDGATIHLREVR
jgi:hypothetical protein